MRTFGELLSEYMARTGISDAELARSIGVRRQTIFRWKEGLVTRPRHREDVLRCAQRLRLTPEERDALLVAAGFPPEEAPPTSAAISRTQPTPRFSILPGEIATPRAGRLASPGSRLTWVVLGAVLLVMGSILFMAIRVSRGPAYRIARPGETLIVVGRFVNYIGEQQGYNVAGRLQGATLVIWGEYDSGRAVVRFTLPGAESGLDERELEALVASPSELTATINSELPQEVRNVALLTLGQLYADRGNFAQARAVLTQALIQPPTEPDALATLYFRLGYVYQVGQPADLGQAIEYYSQVIALQPGWVSAYNNRGVAHLRRGQAGDLDRAIADLTRVIAAMPENAAAYNNRGAVYLERRGPRDLERAVQDFNRAIELAPEAHEA